MKTDINISRNITLSMAPYESIRPNISLTLKDVDTSELEDAYYQLDVLADQLMKLEIARTAEEYYGVNQFESKYKFLEYIEENFDELQSQIKSNLNKLSEKTELD